MKVTIGDVVRYRVAFLQSIVRNLERCNHTRKD